MVINYGERGVQNWKTAGPKLLPPPPLFKEWKLWKDMAKTSNYSDKTTSKLVVPPPL